MRTLSLCAGIAGIELGLGFARPVAFAENAKYPSEVLAHHFPGVPNVGDWTELDTIDPFAVELITGGLPCQPVSLMSNSTRKGARDKRWLFGDLAELLSRSTDRPTVFLENVPPVAKVPALSRLWEALESRGYQCSDQVLPASHAGAPHLRKRWFMLAIPDHIDRSALPVEVPTVPQPPTNPLLFTPTTDVSGRKIGTRDFGIRNMRLTLARFADYAPTLAHWSEIVGRPPPPHLEDGRVSHRFFEWMMGFPEWWADPSGEGKSRGQSFAIGNAVVPHQARLAWTVLVDSRTLF